MDGLRIAQLADRVGVPATTLRFYESQGLLPARRTAGGYRTDGRIVGLTSFRAQLSAALRRPDGRPARDTPCDPTWTGDLGTDVVGPTC